MKPAEEAAVSPEAVATYGGVTCHFVAVILSPTFAFAEYGRVLNTLVLLALLGLVLRAVVSAVFPFARVEPPTVPDGADLPRVAAFVEEFVLDEPGVYVTTSRTDRGSDD